MFNRKHTGGKESTDEQLMLLICNGNRMAFELLYERYFDKLVWFARRFIDDTQQAEDAVQDVFIRIIERPGLFNPEKTFSTWVYNVTANACKNILRNEHNRSRILENNVPSASSASIHHESDYKLLKQRIETARETLNEKEQQIFALRFEQELGIKEIATILNIPEGSVKSGLYYLLKKVSEQIKEFKT